LFQITGPDGDAVAVSDTVDGVVEFVKMNRRGRYQIDQLGTSTPSSGNTERIWGVIVKFPSGDISLQPQALEA
jgi:hypothetical protein